MGEITGCCWYYVGPIPTSMGIKVVIFDDDDDAEGIILSIEEIMSRHEILTPFNGDDGDDDLLVQFISLL